MLFGQAQADCANRVVIGAFGKDQNMQPAGNQANRNEPRFAIIKPVILTFERGFLFKILCSGQRDAVLLQVAVILGRIIFDLHGINVHPIKMQVKTDQSPATAAIAAKAATLL